MAIWKRKITVSDNAVTSAYQLTARESLLPNILVASLFFLWGFAYGLLDVLNSHLKNALGLTYAQSAGTSSAYFGAYFICPPTVSGWILRKYGFRVTFMTGLTVMAMGCVLFLPSTINASFGAYCGSMFVVGAGLATLETAADPFLSICGPPRYSEIRLNLAQAVQGTGSFVAPLLASRVFFANTIDSVQSLKNVQWVYLGVAGFVALLIILFFLAPMPEITNADMGVQEAEIGGHNPGPFRKQYNLFLAVWAQFCYVGAQVAVANYFIPFAEEAGRSTAASSDLLAVGQGLYALNRFIAGFLMMIPSVRPRYVMGLYLTLCTIFVIPAIVVEGSASIAMLILVLCFESACFATIFTLGLRGLGHHTKLGGSVLVAAISGGMVFPPMTGAIVDRSGAHTAMCIPLMGYVLALLYPLYANIWNAKFLDNHRETDVGMEPAAGGDKSNELETQTTRFTVGDALAVSGQKDIKDSAPKTIK